MNTNEKHIYEVGELVELESGARLFIAQLTRDCDGTPLYSLMPTPDHYCTAGEKWIVGYSERSLRIIKVNYVKK